MSFNWTCPHCHSTQTVTDAKRRFSTIPIGIEGTAEGKSVLRWFAVGCSNPDCLRTTIDVIIGLDAGLSTWSVKAGTEIFSRRLIPSSQAKPQPDYIPAPIREDYYEACEIRDLSPKASATLTRRCLQGMIRDFCGIKKGRLIDEIEALKSALQDGSADRAITEESVNAIDHVRGLGNIGAHMEKDIDLIVPVDPGEAQAMIGLLELLFDEWYGAREKRKARLESIERIAFEKQSIRRETSPAAPTTGTVKLSDLVQSNGDDTN